MTLSKQVESSLDEAVASLRNALSFAARNEEPYISKHIADVMFQIENLKNVSNVLACLLYTSPSPRDRTRSRMPSSA